MLDSIKKFVVGKGIDFLIAYIDQNWEALVAQGKEYVIGLLQSLRGALIPEEEVVFGDSPQLVEFSHNIKQVVAKAETEAPSSTE